MNNTTRICQTSLLGTLWEFSNLIVEEERVQGSFWVLAAWELTGLHEDLKITRSPNECSWLPRARINLQPSGGA